MHLLSDVRFFRSVPIRRLPALQPAGLAAAACAKKPEEVEAAALESRNELVRMVGPASSAS